LRRLAAVAQRYGPGMYGLFATHNFCAHLNTTGFACTPKLLVEYPHQVRDHDERYAFEHGDKAFWRWLSGRKLAAIFVTWDGAWFPREWRYAQNILWRGDQSNLLAWCNHSDHFIEADARTKSVWSANADRAFK